jgi:general secretion pathway protein E
MWKRRSLSAHPGTDQPEKEPSGAVDATSAKDQWLESLLAQLNPAADDYAVQLVDRILQVAAARGVSDVHFDASESGIVLRFRTEGQLEQIGCLPQGTQVSIAARLKSLAGLLTYRQDIPQEGRLTFGSPRREARLVTFPTLHGERAVLRVVASHTDQWQIHDLGLSPTALERHLAALRSPSGVVLVAGAVGAGKTTTAYAALRWLARELNRCVVTLEDPIECEIAGIAQSQIDPNVGFDWQSGLRSLLRQDPEAMFIGEIRDAHTAQVAFRASMSGQLVVTTMHARSLGEAWMRLLDMQVPSQHLVYGLRLLTCQSLRPRPCDCGTGCELCRFTGQRGRLLSSKQIVHTYQCPLIFYCNRGVFGVQR